MRWWWPVGRNGSEQVEGAGRVPVGRGAAGVGDAVSVVVGDGGRPDSEESGDHLLRRVGEALLGLLEVGVPDRALPNLEGRAGTDDRDLAVEAGVLAQVGRDREPALLVGDLVGRAGEEDAHVVAGDLARRGGLAHLVGDLDELVHRVDEQAAFLAARDDEPAGHPLAVLRGQEEPTLLVEPGRVRPEKHGPQPPLCRPEGVPIPNLEAPRYSTLLHRQRTLTLFGTASPAFSQVRRGGVKWSSWGTTTRPKTPRR